MVQCLFSPVLWSSGPQAPLALKAKCSGQGRGFLLLMPGLSLKSLPWGLELSILLENFCNIIIFQFVGCIVGRYET